MFGPLLDVQMSLRVAGARDCAPCHKWAECEGFVAASTTTTTTTKTTTTLHYTTLSTLHYTPLGYTTLHYTTPHYTQLHYTQLHYTQLHYTQLHYTQLHYTQLHYSTYTTLHYTTLHYTLYTIHYTLHYYTLHYTTVHYTTLRATALHCTTLITPPHMQLQLRHTNYTKPQLQLHYTAAITTAALHHTTSSSCGWGDRPGDHCNHCNHSKKTQLQPPFQSISGFALPSVIHNNQRLLYIRFLFLKLPQPPCAVLLVRLFVCCGGPRPWNYVHNLFN